MTSKGFASRAARDLLDQIGESVEEVRIFCIHDADAAGTMIYQALQQATKARPGRKVRIINLGLEPAEALEMELQVESVKRKNEKRQPVADYVAEEWQEWLQANRVELNAMTTPQLLEWLDRKMSDYGGKLVPPDEVLAEHLRRDVRSGLDRQITDQVIREAKIDERVETEFGKLERIIRDTLEKLAEHIQKHLTANPSEHWTGPVAGFAEVIIRFGLPGSSAGV
jgi:hypothetical protein